MNIQHMLIVHCAPTLANIKTASMFPIRNCGSDFSKKIEALNRILSKKGMNIIILKQVDDFALVYIYRKKALLVDLKETVSKMILQKYNYPSGTLQEILKYLQGRFTDTKSFPHEIGVFLGYPPNDVKSFIDHQGDNCLYIGHWKVYSDVVKAKKIFKRFDMCKQTYISRYKQGKTFLQLSVA